MNCHDSVENIIGVDIDNKNVDKNIDQTDTRLKVSDLENDAIGTVEREKVAKGPNNASKVDRQSPLLTDKKNGSGNKTTKKTLKTKSPSLLVKLRMGQQTPKSNKKRGKKEKLCLKTCKTDSPTLKLNKRSGKMLSDGKMKSIKDYFENLKSQDRKFPIDRAKDDEVKTKDINIVTVATEKVGVKKRIETFESLFCASTGDTLRKTPVKRLKRLGDNPTR